MKILKSILKCLFWLLILALLIMPVGLLYRVSDAEMQEYTAPESPVIRQVSIGEPIQGCRMDMWEFVTVSGSFDCRELAFMKLSVKNPDEIRWIVSCGEEIQVGQVLGYFKDKEVLSELDGILEEIHTYGDPYLKVRLFTPLVLECQVDGKTLSALNRGGEALKLGDGTAVTLVYASKSVSADGRYLVRLSLDSEKYTYGQFMEEMAIYTGGGYPQVLTLPKNCVYQKEWGEEEQWYVREVTEDGNFIQELPVNISFTMGDFVCVTGIDEGSYYDSGYRAIMEEGT